MRSLFLLLAIAGVAHADRFPATGPCDDIAACEKACKANKRGTCYWGGVLVLQTAAEDREVRAGALFNRACKKGDGEACWQAARLFEAAEDAGAALAAYKRSCAKKHARGCLAFARLGIAAGDETSKQLAEAAQKKGVKLLEQRCVKHKVANACSWVSELYASGTFVAQDEAKAAEYRERQCQLATGKPCPPPPAPEPPHNKSMTKPDTR